MSTLYTRQSLPAVDLCGLQLLGYFCSLASRPPRIGLLPLSRFQSVFGLLALISVVRLSLVVLPVGRIDLPTVVVSHAAGTWIGAKALYLCTQSTLGFAFTETNRGLLVR